MGLGVALALREGLGFRRVQAGSGVVVVGGVAGSCDVGWVDWESEVVEDVADEVGIADVREDGAGTSAGTGENVVEVDALDKRSPVHAAGPRREESGAEAGVRAARVRQLGRIRGATIVAPFFQLFASNVERSRPGGWATIVG